MGDGARVPVGASAASSAPSVHPPVASAVGAAPPAERSWWEVVDARLAARIAATVGAIGILLVGVAPMAAAAIFSATK